jgi:hypothetical protein
MTGNMSAFDPKQTCFVKRNQVSASDLKRGPALVLSFH